MELKRLNRATAGFTDRPVRIMQFGEGNFLRAFVDWQIQLADEAGVLDSNVVIVSPRFKEGKTVKALKEQQGMYHVVLEGIENGKPKRESKLINCIADVLAPALPADYTKYSQYITSPDLRFVVSNTTEAGIRYEKDDVTAGIPLTFPGKITRLLWKRWEHFEGDASKGLVFLPCELIEENGKELRRIVLRHAMENELPAGFAEWVKESCLFVDTLVDRIVTGYPDNAAEVKSEMGYDDNCIVVGELYHLWAIGGEGYETVRKEIPLHEAGLHAIFLPEIKTFRDKKVRILNGSHTGMVPIALQMGCPTVVDAFNNKAINAFINSMVSREVLPMIHENPEELQHFADSILERFFNPYVKHYLKAIALNSLAKWEARNWPTARDYYKSLGKLPRHELLTFASLLSLYGPGSGFVAEDRPEFVEAINQAWDYQDAKGTVERILGAGIFLDDFEARIPGFSAKVADYLWQIRREGMAVTLATFLQNHRKDS